MPISKNYYLPDVNVWLGISFQLHDLHEAAEIWYRTLGANDKLYFCRISQMGLLRLLTNPAAMGSFATTTRGAWDVVDSWSQQGGVEMLPEPLGIDRDFRRDSYLHSGKGSHWTDSYLLAVARQHGLTLVTFDKALAKRSDGKLLHA